MPEAPDAPDAHRLRAIKLRREGKLDQALAEIQRALELRRDYPAGYYNLAAIKMDFGRLDEAEVAWRKAIELKPDYHQAWAGLSANLRRQARHDDAIAAARKAVEIAPESPDARLTLATALYLARKFTDAGTEFEKCLQLDPKNVLALNNYGNLLADTDRPTQAAKCYRRALKLDPDQIEVLANLANVLKSQAHVKDALNYIRQTLNKKPGLWHIHSNLLLTMNCIDEADGSLLADHREWARRHADRFAPADPVYPNDRSPDRRLRIGYVSSDFRRHSVSYFIEPVIQHHNRQAVEIYCYSNAEFTDDTSERIRGLADQWRGIFGMPDERVAQMIRDDRIDILVDLNGHTANHRLLVFARKPAPVQVTYLGYPNTTGLQTIDYRLTDEHADPSGLTDSHNCEKLVRLPHGAWCYQPAPSAPGVRQSIEERKGIVFGSFNNFAKVSPQTFALWVKLLKAAPNTRLLIKAECMSDTGMRQLVRTEFITQDIDPTRIHLIGREASFTRHMTLYHQMDIALDTFPYNGTTTTCEAMWMGVPVVTLAGRAHVSRVGASLMHRVGLDELVGNSHEEYISIAAGLAKDHERRAGISGDALRDRMRVSPLMDAAGFVRQLEHAYRNMWQEWSKRPS